MEIFEAVLQRFPRLWAVYVRWNFCKGSYADGTPKPNSRLFNFFYRLLYMECGCCAAFRGTLLGLALGLILGQFI
jgi:hypothetical protein